MKKNNYWQMIRGVCILCVILIHTLYINNSLNIEYFNIFIRRIINFSTGVFIFMAGYFSKFENTILFYKKKISRVLLPLIIWNIIYLLFHLTDSNITIVSLIKMFIFVKTAPHLYYIIVLLQLFLLCPILLKFINKANRSIFLYLPLLITPLYVLLITIYNITLHKTFILYNYWFFGWISYYYLGLLIRYKEKNSIKIKKINITVPIICMFFSIVEGIIIKGYYGLYDLAISQLTLSNSLYCLMVCIYLHSKSNKNISQKLLYNIGMYSYGIYLSHMLFVIFFKRINSLITLNYYTSIIVLFLLIVVFTYASNKIYYEKVKDNYDRNSRKK